VARWLQCFYAMTANAPRISEPAPAGLGELLEDIVKRADELVRAELALALDELRTELSAAKISLLCVVFGAMFLSAAINLLAVALVLTLGVAPWSAAVIGMLLAFVGTGLTIIALQVTSGKHMRRTTARMTRDARDIASSAGASVSIAASAMPSTSVKEIINE
jgi:uncharacterized integral membrane protein